MLTSGLAYKTTSPPGTYFSGSDLVLFVVLLVKEKHILGVLGDQLETPGKILEVWIFPFGRSCLVAPKHRDKLKVLLDVSLRSFVPTALTASTWDSASSRIYFKLACC